MKRKKIFSGLMTALFVSANLMGSNINVVKAYSNDMPQINFVGIEHTPLVVGDTETFSLTSNYDGDVQYRAFLYNEKAKTWTELTAGYTDPQSSKIPYEIKYEKPFEEGGYKLSIWVKRANEIGIHSNKNGSYDSYYVAALNCLNKNDSDAIYVNKDLHYIIEGLKLKVNGIKEISGIPGPYQYKLHYFDPSTNKWVKNATLEYTEDGFEYIFPKAGTYVIDVHINTKNSKTWANYEADKTNTKGTYEAWKLVVANPKGTPLPNSTTTIEKGITLYDRYVEVKLDTDTPEDYKATVLGDNLKYNTEKKIFMGIVPSANEENIKKGVVVELTKPLEVTIKSDMKFGRYIEMTLDTDTPEKYNVTILGKQLSYDANKKLFFGTISSSDEAAIKNSTVVTTK